MIILVGPSASGKTEVAKLLNIKYGIKKVVTHTTRPMRSKEQPDVDYHFVDKATFLKLKKTDVFVETTRYNNYLYGTSKKEVSDQKVLIVDPNGLASFKALNNPRIITFYMKANEKTRLNRMLYRGDLLSDARQRIKNDQHDFKIEKIGNVDYTIDTDVHDIEQVTDLVYELYQKKLKNI
jgi:guanylate kinase